MYTFSPRLVPIAIFFPAIILGFSYQASAAGQVPGSSSTAASDSQYHLQLPVPLVIEDVVVADGKNHPVHGLKPDDFTVMENGKRVQLRSFEEHVSLHTDPSKVVSKPVQPAGLGPNTFTNIPQISPSGSLNVLLLDALNTPLADQAHVRQQMLEFAANRPAGTNMAVFGLGNRLMMIQGFTADPAELRAALENQRGAPQQSALRVESERADPRNTLDDAVSDWIIHNIVSTGMQMRATHKQTSAHQDTVLLRERVILTLEAMNELARYLSALPGHKNLIWFSTAFPLSLDPNNELADPFSETANFHEAVHQTSDLLARSRVAVYPVDGRGILGDSEVFNPQLGKSQWLEVHEPAIADEKSKLLQADQTYAEHDTMEHVAAATGGRAIFNTNDFKGAVNEIIDYGDNYYTVTYSPAAQKFDGAYRKIAVKLNNPDLHVFYRAGYFANDPNAPASGKAVLPLSAMQTAMLHGAPDAIQIHFDAILVPSEKPVDQLSPGGRPDPKLMKPPYARFQVQFAIDIRTVHFTVDEKNVHHGSLELASMVYDVDGNPANSTLSRVNIDLPDEKFVQIAQQGVLTRQIIEAPAKGDYFLRAGIHDLTGDRVGALEIPLSRVKSLQEMQAESAKQSAKPPQ
jgi:VWFA-related protein